MININYDKKQIEEVLLTEYMKSEVNKYEELMKWYSYLITSDSYTFYERKGFEYFFMTYYGMDGTGMYDSSKEKYFKLLFDNTRNKSIDLKTVLNEISNTTVYFSFATKLFATIDTSKPIFDDRVRRALGLPNVSGKNYEERIESAIKIYVDLENFYNSEEKNYKDFRCNCVSVFNEVYDNNCISNEKKIDFVLWGLVALI